MNKIKYCIEFYQTLDRRMENGVTVLMMFLVHGGISIYFLNTLNFKSSANLVEQFLLAGIAGTFILLLLFLVGFLVTIAWSFFGALKQEIKQTKAEMGEIPPKEGKIRF